MWTHLLIKYYSITDRTEDLFDQLDFSHLIPFPRGNPFGGCDILSSIYILTHICVQL